MIRPVLVGGFFLRQFDPHVRRNIAVIVGKIQFLRMLLLPGTGWYYYPAAMCRPFTSLCSCGMHAIALFAALTPPANDEK